jgi:hypothetical protein
MNTRWLLVLMASSLIVISGVRIIANDRFAVAPRPDEPVAGLMLAKLANSQRILTGLVSKDFGEIKRGAEGMHKVCDASQWESNPDSIYGQYRNELRRQSLKLTQLADEQNLDGAAFHYMQSVATCINCHQHCRDVLRIASFPGPANRVISIPTSQEEADWSSIPIMRR